MIREAKATVLWMVDSATLLSSTLIDTAVLTLNHLISVSLKSFSFFYDYLLPFIVLLKSNTLDYLTDKIFVWLVLNENDNFTKKQMERRAEETEGCQGFYGDDWIFQQSSTASKAERVFKASGVKGISNIGNSCYFNSLIQALFNHKYFALYINKPFRFHSDEPAHVNLARVKIHSILKQWFEHYHKPGAETDKQSEYAEKLRNACAVLSPDINKSIYGMQDVYSMLLPIFNAMDYSCQYQKTISFDHFRKPVSVSKEEKISVIQIALWSGELDLQSLIQNEFKPELINSKDNAYHYYENSDKEYIEIDKYTIKPQLKAKTPPELLTLQMKRFNPVTFQKDDRPLIIPKDDIVSLRSVFSETVDYKITGYIVHLPGHYVSYILKGDQWYYCSDSWVKPVSSDEVKREDAYLLVLERQGTWGPTTIA